jgi:hypothetical protein
MSDLSTLLGRSPEVFPYGFNSSNDTVSFIRLSRADFDAASFLDARILSLLIPAQTIPWRQVSALVEATELPEGCDFIFHIGHVGSTLMSRLIGCHPGVFALREPMVLREFAQIISEPEVQAQSWSESDFDARLGGCLKLLSRTFDAQQNAVIKATSFVSELAAGLLSRASAPRAMMMVVPAETYLATILGGPNSRRETKILCANRLRRLHRRIGREAWRLESLSEGETVAVSWACEMSALAHAASVAGERVLRLDFDEFLADPTRHLRSALRHFNIDATGAELDAIFRGPHMGRYSKAPEDAYDAALRGAVLKQARASHAAEIKRGLSWLERAAVEFVPVRDAVEFAAGA